MVPVPLNTTFAEPSMQDKLSSPPHSPEDGIPNPPEAIPVLPALFSRASDSTGHN